jgi:hypothetical protein
MSLALLQEVSYRDLGLRGTGFGRRQPTFCNPAKPRDRSHYERFRSYHAALYRWVEPTSVTQFAAPVRARALHALLVTLVCFWGDDQNQEFPNPFPAEELLDEIRPLLRRARMSKKGR